MAGSTKAILDDAVSRAKDESWAFQCPGVDGSPCGEPVGQPFHSSGWPTKAVASARGAQHFAEHKGEGPMASLDEFRAEHGLAAHSDGTHTVRIEDLP
jgi:hypothetical protein